MLVRLQYVRGRHIITLAHLPHIVTQSTDLQSIYEMYDPEEDEPTPVFYQRVLFSLASSECIDQYTYHTIKFLQSQSLQEYPTSIILLYSSRKDVLRALMSYLDTIRMKIGMIPIRDQRWYGNLTTNSSNKMESDLVSCLSPETKKLYPLLKAHRDQRGSGGDEMCVLFLELATNVNGLIIRLAQLLRLDADVPLFSALR